MAVDSPFKTLWWARSLTTDVVRYRIDQQVDGGDWETIAYVWARADQWDYQYETDTLDDLSEYAWRITPIDSAENACDDPVEVGSEKIVRTPDAVNCEVTFNSPATTVTFSEASTSVFGGSV